ncbi:MAG: hypothetical protein M1827_006492 [Pycnora praestabilis]|nr:MAG: hypothetical protein M1827_006492 [Pycnora praestabilis]
MADLSPLYLYKETRVNLEQANPGSAIYIHLTAHGGSNNSSRALLRRQQDSENAQAEDEQSFIDKFTASSASIYFRQSHKYPRSFLWRVLEDGKVLEVRSVDLSKAEQEKDEAALTLKFVFSSAIRPAGVALSDPTKRDLLNVFVLTSSNDLYTLSLKPDFFSRSEATEASTSSWCRTFLPSSFSLRYPHRLYACNAEELFISLHDGGLLRLTRKPEDDGSQWRESLFTEGNWGSSIRGFIPWKGQNTIRYGDIDLEQTTVTSVVTSPSKSHIYTVSLNHTLKAWNLSTGKISFTKDLLNKERQPQELAKYLIDPATPQLIQVLNIEGVLPGNRHHIVTYSPIGAGQFKFWAVDESREGIEDLYPDDGFTAPEPLSSSSDVWSMAQFKITSANVGPNVDIWILWKNNTSSQIRNSSFDVTDLPRTWSTGWIATASETVNEAPRPVLSDLDPSDTSDQWLEYLFFPGRFTRATLETSLSVYLSSNKDIRPGRSVSKSTTLKERLCYAVASLVILGRSNAGNMDYQRYRRDTHAQWQRLWRTAVGIEKRRGEAISLVYDDYSYMPWVITIDGVSAIRECSDTELLWHNHSTMQEFEELLRVRAPHRRIGKRSRMQPNHLAGLVNAATLFRDGFSEPLEYACKATLESELLQDPSYSASARIRSFYDRCNFAGQIGDEEYNQLINALKDCGGVKELDNRLFLGVLETIGQDNLEEGHMLISTSFGAKILVQGAEETIYQNLNILFSLLVLVVFVAVEIDSDEEPLEYLDAAKIYIKLLRLLKEYVVLQWLAKTSRPLIPAMSVGDHDLDKRTNQRTDLLDKSHHYVPNAQSTLLQSLFISFWKFPPALPEFPLSSVLTYAFRCWISSIPLLNSYNTVVPNVMCNLLREGNLDLALGFLQYLPNTAWATYLKGRLYTSRKDYSLAAIHFKKAAFGLAKGRSRAVGPSESNGLLDLLEVKDLSNNGFPRYYLHILTLFEQCKAYSFVADFARLAMHFVRSGDDDDLRSQILSRLFYASIYTCDFDEAYMSLTQFPDTVLQKAAITTLLTTMMSQNFTSQLLSFPFLGLYDTVDAILSSLCQKILNISTGPPYHKVLYAFRLSRNDFRGAAAVLHQRLQRLRTSSISSKDSHNEVVTQGYLSLINVLASVEPSQAWLLAEGYNGISKRRVVTLEDVRKEYQEELDREAMIENNQFSFAGVGDEMDVL